MHSWSKRWCSADMCRTMASLPRSVLRSSPGLRSRPTITPRPLRAARAARRVRAERDQRRKKAPRSGNTVTSKYCQFRMQRIVFICQLYSWIKNSILPVIWHCSLFTLFTLSICASRFKSQGRRHGFSQHNGGPWRWRRRGRWRASWWLWGSDHAGAEGESSVYVMILNIHRDLMENSKKILLSKLQVV